MLQFIETTIVLCTLISSVRCIFIKSACDDEGRPVREQFPDVEGIHDRDICRLFVRQVAPADEATRACTAALILVDGQAMAVTAATCFLPNNPAAFMGHFKQTATKAFAFKGKVELTCGPDMDKLEIESDERNENVLVHKDFFHKELAFYQKNNMAVVRIDKEDYDRIKKRENWLFTRMTSGETLGPTQTTTCRCFTGVEGETGKAEPQKYEVERCSLTRRIGAIWNGEEHTCFRVKQNPDDASLFNKLATNRAKNCKNEYCGLLQTMACFCQAKQPTADSLRSLHSFGFYQKDPNESAKELTFMSTPLKPNWEFIQGAKRRGKEIGATNSDLENIRKNLGKVIDDCIIANELPSYIIKRHLCMSFVESSINVKPTDMAKYEINANRLFNARKQVFECASKNGLALIPKDPDTGKTVRVPPLTEVLEMIGPILGKHVVCPKKDDAVLDQEAKVHFIEAVAKMADKAICLGLAIRRVMPLYFMKSHEAKETLFGITGVIPGIPGLLWMLACGKITESGSGESFCINFSFLFGIGGLVTGAVSVGVACVLDAAVQGAIKAGKSGVELVQAGIDSLKDH